MTIEDIDLSKLKPYKTSKTTSFEMMWYLLAEADYQQVGVLTPIDDSGGGDGVEFYLTLPNGDIWGWQCKFFDRLSEGSRKKQIITSLQKAIKEHGQALKKWFLCSLSDLTPKEKEWFDKLNDSNKTESTLECIHLGESAAISLLHKNPKVANLFFGPISIPDDWIRTKAEASLNRDVFKKRYINSLHAETDTEKSLLICSGHRDVCRIMKERIDTAGYKGFIDSFRDSISLLKEYDCPNEWQTIKDEALNIINGKEDIAERIIDLYKEGLDYPNLFNDGNCQSKVFDLCYNLKRLYDVVDELYNSLSKFKNSDVLKPVHWDTQDDCLDETLSESIKNCRETVLGPYFVLRNYIDPISYLLWDFMNFEEIEFHIDGGAAKGKTHLILNVFEKYISNDLPALLLSGRDFTTEENIEKQIQSLLGITNEIDFEDFVSMLNLLGKIKGCKALIIIDGLNESQYWNKLWQNGLDRIRTTIKALDAKNILLVTTFRTSYNESIFGKYLWEHDSIWHTIDGLPEDSFNETVNLYLKHFNISIYDKRGIPYYFKNNPLALRMFCEVHKGKCIALSRMSIFNVFDDYLSYCNENIIRNLGRNLKFNKNFLNKILSKIAQYLFLNNTNCMPINELGLSHEEIESIEGEDLIFYRELYTKGLSESPEEVVHLTYDLLSGYIIAKEIIKNIESKSVFISFIEKEFINVEGEDCTSYLIHNEDVTYCLIYLAFSKFGYVEELKSYKFLYAKILNLIYSFEIDFVKSYEDQIKRFIHECGIDKSYIFKLSLDTLFVNEHPLNFRFLSEMLSHMDITERDLTWTNLVTNLYRNNHLKGLPQRTKELTTLPKSSYDELYLRGVFLMWLLTTNTHSLRFEASHSLYILGAAYPNLYLEILSQALEINDLYVPERVIAVGYGIALRYQNNINEANEFIPKLANIIYLKVFSSSQTISTTHILIRDYCRKIIELANKLFPNTISDEKLINVYKKGIVTDKDIALWPRQEWFEEPMRMDFSNYTLGVLIKDGQSYSDPILKQQSRGYILRRIKEIGWTKESFSTVDEYISSINRIDRHNDSTKIDRFGKKYSWIAFYELAGILSDNSLLHRFFPGYREISIDIDPTFPDPCQEKHLDIKSYLDENIPFDEWINSDQEEDFSEIYSANIVSDMDTDFICVYGYISEENIDIDRKRFTFFRPFLCKKNEKDDFVHYLYMDDLRRRWLAEIRENDDCFAGEITFWPEATTSNWVDMEFKRDEGEMAQKQREVFELLCSIKNGGSTSLFDKVDQILVDLQNETVSFHVLMPIMNYHTEFDNSIGIQSTIAKEIIFSEELQYIPQSFNLNDREGNLAAFSVMCGQGWNQQQHFVFLRKDILDSFLKKNDMSMIWLAWGEKNCCNPVCRSIPCKQIDEYDPSTNFNKD